MTISIAGQILPLQPYPQRLTTVLNSVTYSFRTRWSDLSECWMLDIADEDNVPMIGSIPIVTGANLIEQYDYLDIGGGLYAYSSVGRPDTVPTYTGLGVNSFVVYIPNGQ